MDPVELLNTQLIALEAQIRALRATLDMMLKTPDDGVDLPEIQETPSGPRVFGQGAQQS